VLLTAIILIGFAVLIYQLAIQFQIEISRELNDCTNPLAIYFDKDIRNKCLQKHIANKNENVNKIQKIMKKFDTKTAPSLEKSIQDLVDKNTMSNLNYENVQNMLSQNEAQEILNGKQSLIDLSGVITTIKTQYQENSKDLMNLVNDYENQVNTNIQFIVEVGNSLVNKLLSNVYTKKFEEKRKTMVGQYERIKAYLDNLIQTKQIDPRDRVLRDLTKDEIQGRQ
jgi:oligoendopeptidase F